MWSKAASTPLKAKQSDYRYSQLQWHLVSTLIKNCEPWSVSTCLHFNHPTVSHNATQNWRFFEAVADITADVMDARTDVRTKASWQRGGSSCGTREAPMEPRLVDLDEALNEPRTKHRLGLGQSKDLQRSSQCSIVVEMKADETSFTPIHSSYCNLLSYIIIYYIIGQWQTHDTHDQRNIFGAACWDPNIWRAHPIHTSYHLWLTEEVAC